MKKIITTVGTSIFTNYQKSGQNKINGIDNYLSVIEESSDSANEYHHHESSIDQLKKRVKDFFEGWKKDGKDGWKKNSKNPQQPNEDICAEVKSVLAIANENKEEGIEVYLLATDTILSVVACELIKEWFENYSLSPIKVHFDIVNYVIKGLQIEDAKLFKQSFVDFVEKVNQISQFYYNNIILNITGGYKALIPYMTILGQVRKMRINYIFEDTNSLIEIPAIPISVNEQLFKIYETQFKLIELDVLKQSKEFNFFKDCESLLLIENGEGILNELGVFLWNEYKNKYFSFFTTEKIMAKILENKRMLEYFNQTFIDPQLRNSSNVTEQTHQTVCKKFSDVLRIYWFEFNNNIYVYEAFDDHDKHERFINAVKLTDEFKSVFINQAQNFRIEKNNH